MAKVTHNFDELIDRLKVADRDIDGLYEEVFKGVAKEFLTDVINRTPMGESGSIPYRASGGKVAYHKVSPGQLRRGWIGESKPGATPSGAEIGAYVDRLSVKKGGSVRCIELDNVCPYYPFVENGHMQHVGRYVPWIGSEKGGVVQGATLQRGYIPGKYFFRKSASLMEAKMPVLCERLANQWLKKKLDGS